MDNYYSIYLHDISGKIIYKNEQIIGKINTLNFSNLADGLYFIKINNGIDELTKKVIIKH